MTILVNRGRRLINRNTIETLGCFNRYVTVDHILLHGFGFPFKRRADSPTTAADLAEHLSCLDLDHAVCSNRLNLVTATDVHLRQGARITAGCTGRLG